MSAGPRAGAVVVTGASGGIGRAVARRLAGEFPANPLVLGYRSTEPVDLAAELSGPGVTGSGATGPGDHGASARTIGPVAVVSWFRTAPGRAVPRVPKRIRAGTFAANGATACGVVHAW